METWQRQFNYNMETTLVENIDNHLVTTPTPNGLEEMKVQSLIIHDNKVWHDDLLQQLFHTNEIQQIKSIPLININYNDTQIWKLTYDVNYIVRSTYHFIMDFLYHDESNKVPSKWKQLWSLKYPTKIQAPHLENSKRFPTYKSETTFKRSTMPIHLCFLEKQPGKQLVSTLWL